MADNRKLKPILMNAGRGVFAVLDGAQFDDLPKMLFDRDFIHKPLYLDRGNGTDDQLRAGPQLVWLDRDWGAPNMDDTDSDRSIQEVVVDRLLDFICDRPATVFWQCEKGGDALYRHLRSINKVLYPHEQYLESSGPIPKRGFDMVVFRHADSNVMAQVVPALSWQGLSRLLGPAETILFSPDADWSEKVMRLHREENMPPAYSGPLKIDREEILAMEHIRFSRLTDRTVTYLREYGTEHTSGKTDEELRNDTQIWLKEAQTYGVTEEAAFRKWCYLQLASKGSVRDIPGLHDYMSTKDPSVSANEKVHATMKAVIMRLEAA